MKINLRLAERSCGSCTICCTSLGVAGVPGYGAEPKLAGKSCKHIAFGCAIYATRPVACSSFECGWLSLSRGLDEELRPDRSGLVIAPTTMNLSAKGRAAPMLKKPMAWSIQVLRKDAMERAVNLGRWMIVEIGQLVGAVCIDATFRGYGWVEYIVLGDRSLVEGESRQIPFDEALAAIGARAREEP